MSAVRVRAQTKTWGLLCVLLLRGSSVSANSGIARAREPTNVTMAMRCAACVGLTLLLTRSPAVAQAQGTTAPPSAPPALKVGSLDLSLSWRSRVEHWDWFEGTAGDSHYAFGH